MAREKLSDDEIHAVESIVMAVSAGRVMMQHADAREAKDGGQGEDNGVADRLAKVTIGPDGFIIL